MLPLKQQRAKEAGNSRKSIIRSRPGYGRCCPRWAIQVQAALERRCSLWESGGFTCFRTRRRQGLVLGTGWETMSRGVEVRSRRNSERPTNRATTVALSPCKHHSATDSPWGPHPPAPGSWEPNMAKGMSKLVRVTWRDAGQSISAAPSPSVCFLRGFQKGGRGCASAGSHTSAGHATLRFLSCWRPLQSPCFPAHAHSIHRTLEFSSGSTDHSSSVTSVPHWQSCRGTFLFQARLSW